MCEILRIPAMLIVPRCGCMQLPDISSLREINLFCTVCTICFAVGCLALSIYDGECARSHGGGVRAPL